MSFESEPYNPPPSCDEDDKKRTVESLYNYYSYLLMEQNREKLFSWSERYKELAVLAEAQRATLEEVKPPNPLLEMNLNDEFTSLALGFHDLLPTRLKPSTGY